jgi:hypothetical protein
MGQGWRREVVTSQAPKAAELDAAHYPAQTDLELQLEAKGFAA